MKKAFAGVLLAVFAFSVIGAPTAKAFSLNVTTDIHAGSQKKRDMSKYTAGNIISPKKWDKYFKGFMSSNADVYLTLGDNTNTGKDWKKARDIRKLLDKKFQGKTVLFTYGNHDSDKGFRYLSSQKYYAFDKENWRIIVVNTEEGDAKISDTQLSWLKEQVKTDKKVLIAMHEPAFSIYDRTTVDARFQPFLDIVKANKNIKYVLGGHYHVFNETKEVEGYEAKFVYVQALTLKNHEGNFLKLNLE